MGTYIRLVDINDAKGKESAFLSAVQDKNSSIRFETSAENFSKIPGSPVAYWTNENLINIFSKGNLIKDFFEVRNGITTGQNDLFIRYWFEVTKDKKYKWLPCNKGGTYRKWYGNYEYVINWENDGYSLKNFCDPYSGKRRATLRSIDFNFHEAITMSRITSGALSFRWLDCGFITEGASNNIYFKNCNVIQAKHLLSLLNSKVGDYVINLYNPTVNVMPDDLRSFPIVFINNETLTTVEQNITIAKADWDAFETSWDFTNHPFITHKGNGQIENSFKNWEEFAERQFYQLKGNEEKLNRIFIDIYGLKDELTPEVAEKDVTVRKADLGRDIRSFISYAVGCMFGRYSLDTDGLAYAGGVWDQSKYKTYIPDVDNCIPITDEEYFDDDVVSRFVDFVKTVYGKDTLGKNLEFIAEALGNRGDTPLKTIRNYFINEFYKDHVKTYQKRPIYWLSESGKENGFKALIYMHRYNADTIGNMRIEYIHKLQAKYESQLSFEQHLIDTSQNQREKSAAIKQKEKLIRQIKEIKDYDVKIAHLANCRIEIDLDDGVKVNYEKVQTGKDGKKLEVLGKI